MRHAARAAQCFSDALKVRGAERIATGAGPQDVHHLADAGRKRQVVKVIIGRGTYDLRGDWPLRHDEMIDTRVSTRGIDPLKRAVPTILQTGPCGRIMIAVTVTAASIGAVVPCDAETCDGTGCRGEFGDKCGQLPVR